MTNVRRLPTTWSGERDPKTHPRKGDRFTCDRYDRGVLGFHAKNRWGWWEPTTWETCTHVRYATARSSARMTKARWLAWVADTQVVELGPDPEAPNRYVSRRPRCRRFSERERCAEFAWGTASWKSAELGHYELDLTIAGQTFGYRGLQNPDLRPMTMTLMALGIVTGAGIAGDEKRAELQEHWDEAWRKDIREV